VSRRSARAVAAIGDYHSTYCFFLQISERDRPRLAASAWLQRGNSGAIVARGRFSDWYQRKVSAILRRTIKAEIHLA